MPCPPARDSLLSLSVFAVGLTQSLRAAAPIAPRFAFVQISPMAEARVNHTATALEDGTVLLVGGANASGVALSAELFDSRTNTSSKTGSPLRPRYLHTATLLSDGRVLLVGGIGRAN